MVDSITRENKKREGLTPHLTPILKNQITEQISLYITVDQKIASLPFHVGGL